MSRYVSCVFAQRHLEGFVDRELPIADEVLVESHLRWCSTCAARVEDLQMIRAALRSSVRRAEAPGERELAAMRAELLDRVDLERQQSYAARLTDLARACADLRFVWPAVGASAALALCVGLATAMWQTAVEQQPTSLAAMIDSLADPGSNRNPLRLDGAMLVPRVLDDQGAVAHAVLDEHPAAEDDVVAVAAVVTREGKIGTYELLRAASVTPGHVRNQEAVADLLDAVRRARFAPAQWPSGRNVAVNVVWLFATTTVKASSMPVDLGVPLQAPLLEPVTVRARAPRSTVAPPETPTQLVEPVRRSGVAISSTTA